MTVTVVRTKVFERRLVRDLLSLSLSCDQLLTIFLLTLSQTTHFRLFQTKRVADDNFKLDENGRTFSKRIENTVGKGEIARYEQFLLFPQCFQRTFTADTLKPGLVWKRVNMFPSVTNTVVLTLEGKSTK